MRIIFEQPQPGAEDEIIVRCAAPDPHLLSMLYSFKLEYTTITGYQENSIARLPYQEIYYFESIDNRVFAYCEKNVYEVRFKLYELEENYKAFDFIRCSKSVILNIAQIECLSPLFNGRLEAKLKNGEKIIISRQYVQTLKYKLGIVEEKE